MKLKILLESLRDISTENVLYHGTNFYSLIKILKSGYLKPSSYAYSLKSSPEIATGRKGFLNNRSPSTHIHGVMFHLYPERIIGSKEHRDVKKYAISELSILNLRTIESFKKYNNLIKNHYKDIVKIFEKEYSKYNYQFDTTLLRDMFKKLIDKVSKKYKDECSEDDRGDLYTLFNCLVEEKKYKFEREQEERFYFNKKDKVTLSQVDTKYGIKVDPRFMKIGLDVKAIKKDVSLNYSLSLIDNEELIEKLKIVQKIELLNKLIDLFKQYKAVFFEDDYMDLMKMFEGWKNDIERFG